MLIHQTRALPFMEPAPTTAQFCSRQLHQPPSPTALPLSPSEGGDSHRRTSAGLSGQGWSERRLWDKRQEMRRTFWALPLNRKATWVTPPSARDWLQMMQYLLHGGWARVAKQRLSPRQAGQEQPGTWPHHTSKSDLKPPPPPGIHLRHTAAPETYAWRSFLFSTASFPN